MKKSLIFSLCLILILLSCGSKSKFAQETLKIEEFKWTIDIPEDYEKINEEEWDEYKKKGKGAIDQTFGVISENRVRTIFAYKKGNNRFEANWQPYDTEIYGNYLETSSNVFKAAYITLETQIPDAKLDSVSSIRKVGEFEFYRFDIKAELPNGMSINTISYCRLFDNKDFTVNLISHNEEELHKMLNAFLNSVFE